MREQTPVHVAFSPGIEARLDSYFLTMGLGLNTHLLRRERREILLWLNAKSDAELAVMGLARPDIPAFVFRDLFGD
jgi:hypothetical protein